MKTLDAKVFGAELMYNDSPQIYARMSHPMSIYASALTDDGAEMIGYLSLTITTEHYYQALLANTAKEEDFIPWDQKDTPLLFIRNLVIRNRRATPYLFRSALKELHSLCALHDIYLHRAFTIASHWTTRKALQTYQFQTVGQYQGRYPILLASRDTSIVLNSFLKRYDLQ